MRFSGNQIIDLLMRIVLDLIFFARRFENINLTRFDAFEMIITKCIGERQKHLAVRLI